MDAENLSRYVKLSAEFDFECSAILFKKTLCVISLYRSQVGSFDTFVERLSDVLADIMSRNIPYVIICGDLNIDFLETSSNYYCLRDLFSSHGLQSLINEPTRVFRYSNGNISVSGLDYLVTNIPQDNITSCLNFDPALSDHHVQYLSWVMEGDNTENRENLCKIVHSRNISAVHLAEFKKLFITTDNFYSNFITTLNYVTDVDIYFDAFMEHFLWCYNATCPEVTKMVPVINKPNKKIHFSQAVKLKSRELRDLNCLRKSLADLNVENCYRQRKNELSRLITAEKQTFYSNLINSSQCKSRTTWQLVNASRGVSKHQKSIHIVHEGEIVRDAKVLSKLFGDYFSEVVGLQLNDYFGNNLSTSCTVTDFSVSKTMFMSPVTPREVCSVIASLPNKRSTGYDGVTTDFIKKVGHVTSEILSALINISLNLGKFPNCLKSSVIIPVPKKGNTAEISNYRPISLLSVFSKIFERIVADKISVFLERHSLLTGCQHGFRKGHSTETAIVQLTQYVNDKLDNDQIVIAIFFDLSRAFDTLHPAFVSEKIAKLGLRGNINQWIMSYLCDRQFLVKVEHEHSDFYSVNTGTPQGSVLGPLIFLLYVNDLPDHITDGTTFMYADDTTIVISDSGVDGVCRKLEGVIAQFKYWCDKNRLIINFAKTQYVHFRGKSRHVEFGNVRMNDMNNAQLVFNSEVKFLGAVVDSCFTWKQHIEYVADKLSSAYYAITSLKNKFSKETLMSVYYALVYPHLSYAVAVWGQSTDSSRLFILQKRIIRRIFDLRFRTSCRETFRSVKILTLTSIYLLKILTFIHENRRDFSTHSDRHNYDTRGKLSICPVKHYHSYYEKSPAYAGVCLYNLLPSSFRNDDVQVHVFKRKLKKLLVDGCYYDVGEFVDSMRNGR